MAFIHHAGRSDVGGHMMTPSRRMRFSVRGLCVSFLFAAVIGGWYSSLRRFNSERRYLENCLRYAERELGRATDQLSDLPRPNRTERLILEGSNLADSTIASPRNAFQKASFCECLLENATLEGGGASFQLARFDDAKLRRAKLKGGVASFQCASLVNADLTGAELSGEGSSFDGANFEKAILINAKLLGSFQGVNISGAKLAGADLTSINSETLAGWYFKVPPTYDAKTKFPAGFDPVKYFWRKTE